jgi:hypothetical protein
LLLHESKVSLFFMQFVYVKKQFTCNMFRKNKNDKRAKALTAAFVAFFEEDDEEELPPFHSSAPPPVVHLKYLTFIKKN